MSTYFADLIYLILEATDFLMIYLVLFHLKLKKPLQVFEILAMAASKKSVRLRFYSVWQYITLLTGLIIIFLIVGLIQYVMQRGSSYDRELNIMMAAFLFFTACFFLLFILMQLASQKALKYRLESEREKYALEKQKAYIDHLNEENLSRRKIQHDINAHITAINGLIDNKDFDGLREYMERFEHDGRNIAFFIFFNTKYSSTGADTDEWVTT